MLNIEDLDYHELRDAHVQINDRRRELEDAALATLAHQPLKFGWRLIKIALALKPRQPIDQQQSPDTEMAQSPTP